MQTESKSPVPPPEKADAAAGAADPMHDIIDRVRHITRENERLFQRLIEGERRFRGLAKAVWKVQEDERRRLARELHDGLGQTLTALTNQLERLQQKLDGSGSAELSERLADSVEMARLALNESRELSRLLRPPVLDDLGLPAALSWLARNLEQRTGLTVDLNIELDLGGVASLEERLDPELETLVFRVVQETLTNVLRHSGADHATVTVSRAQGLLELRVADRGCGFDARGAFVGHEAAGSGLRGMRDRLELFGGRLEIVSSPGEGTLVFAEVPLETP